MTVLYGKTRVITTRFVCGVGWGTPPWVTSTTNQHISFSNEWVSEWVQFYPGPLELAVPDTEPVKFTALYDGDGTEPLLQMRPFNVAEWKEGSISPGLPP